MDQEFLYRGVNSDLHRLGNGLRSKATEAFSDGARYGEAAYGTGWTYGDSEANAVLRHQLDQAGFATAGISTTPIYQRAVFYATSAGEQRTGYVYRINRQALASNGVREFIVSEFTATPSVPEDQEVILVVESGGCLPAAVIQTIIEINL